MYTEPEIELRIASEHFPTIENLHLSHTNFRGPFSKSITFLTLSYCRDYHRVDWSCFSELQHLTHLFITEPTLTIQMDTLDGAIEYYGPPSILSGLQVLKLRDVR